MVLIGILRRVDIAAIIDDRRALQAQPAIGDLAALIAALQRRRIGLAARGAVIAVIVETADGAIEINELLGRDGAGLQRRKAILHAGIVPGPPGCAGLGVLAEDIDRVVINIAAHATGILGAAEAGALRDHRIAIAPFGLDAHRQRGQGSRGGGIGIAGGCSLLFVAPV